MLLCWILDFLSDCWHPLSLYLFRLTRKCQQNIFRQQPNSCSFMNSCSSHPNLPLPWPSHTGSWYLHHRRCSGQNPWRRLWLSPVCYPGFPGGQMVKNLPAVQETQVQSMGWEDPLKEEMATQSSILDWRIPWTEEPGRLQFVEYQRVRHDWATNTRITPHILPPWC